MVLNAGAVAPDFRLIDHRGEEVSLAESLENGPVALVFFPLAFSGICTNELCELRDNLAVFEERGVQLMGISVDSKFSLQAWAAEEGYEFPLLSDFWPHGEVATQYGVFDAETGLANRATLVIDQQGTIVASFENPRPQARELDEYRAAVAKLTERV